MKLIFSLAVITSKDQKIDDLLKPYIRNKYDEELKKCMQEQKHFISGVLFGDFDGDYEGRLLLLKDEKNKNYLGYKAKIKDVEWEKMVELDNEQLKENGVNIDKEGLNLEERYCFTNAIITPDGN